LYLAKLGSRIRFEGAEELKETDSPLRSIWIKLQLASIQDSSRSHDDLRIEEITLKPFIKKADQFVKHKD